jgi:hypothetical protein
MKGKIQKSKCYKILEIMDSYEKENKLGALVDNVAKKQAIKQVVANTIKLLVRRYGVEIAKHTAKKAGVVVDLLFPSNLADGTHEGGFLLDLDLLHKELENQEFNVKKGKEIASRIKNQAQMMISGRYYGDSPECYLALTKIVSNIEKYMNQLSTQPLV